MSTSTTASTITTFLADTEPPNSLFSCLIDRTRNVKYSSTSQPNAKPKQAANNAASTTASSSLVANVNLFYELLQSMPELSKLEIRYFETNNFYSPKTFYLYFHILLSIVRVLLLKYNDYY